MAFQEGGSSLVICRRCFRVLAAIDFDRQLCLSAGEVDDVRIDHQLTCERRAIAREPPPQKTLSFCGAIP